MSTLEQRDALEALIHGSGLRELENLMKDCHLTIPTIQTLPAEHHLMRGKAGSVWIDEAIAAVKAAGV